MKKIMIILWGISLLGLANANEQIGELKSTATMNATCSISANSINFGVVATPLMIQTASNEMAVKCSNESAYTIDLTYGGIYGQGSSGSGYNIAHSYEFVYENQYTIYNNAGIVQGTITCGFGGAYTGKVHFSNTTIANLYGATWTPNVSQDISGACISNNTRSGTYPKGWVGTYNSKEKQSIGGKIGYEYGVMSGVSKGDALAYSIAVPGDSSKVWNAGVNSYKATGTGDFQTIAMEARIVPDKSGSKYPAPDMYLDTITAIISY